VCACVCACVLRACACTRERGCVNANDDGEEDGGESTYRMMTGEGSCRK